MIVGAAVVPVIVPVTIAAISLHPGTGLRAICLVFSKQAHEAAIVRVCTLVMSTHKLRGAEELARGHKDSGCLHRASHHVLSF